MELGQKGMLSGISSSTIVTVIITTGIVHHLLVFTWSQSGGSLIISASVNFLFMSISWNEVMEVLSLKTYVVN